MDQDPRAYTLAVLRFPGNHSEHPGSSGWVIKHMPIWGQDPRIARVVPLRHSDTPITMVRNLLVQKALEEGADYILMIDSDVIPDCEPDGVPFWQEAWGFLMERRRLEATFVRGWEEVDGPGTPEELADHLRDLHPPATVAAPYCGAPPDEVVFVARWAGSETNSPDWPRPYKLALYERDHAALFSGIMPAAALPTGLILYDARVFKALPPPWFDYEWTDEHRTKKATTEDFYQTRNASILGLPQFCAWSSWAGHWKPKLVRRPRPLDASAVPQAFADAVRRHKGEGPGRVVYWRSAEDAPSRWAEGPPPG